MDYFRECLSILVSEPPTPVCLLTVVDHSLRFCFLPSLLGLWDSPALLEAAFIQLLSSPFLWLHICPWNSVPPTLFWIWGLVAEVKAFTAPEESLTGVQLALTNPQIVSFTDYYVQDT